MSRAFVALGSNLGDSTHTINEAIKALTALRDSSLVAISSLYQTAPVGLQNQPDFINAVAAIDTHQSPLALLDALFDIEARFRRVRSIKNAPRTLDLDLLLYGDTVMKSPTLTLPHPRLHERAFVLMPLLEIAPDILIPELGPAAHYLQTTQGNYSGPVGTQLSSPFKGEA
ncbi:MAG: 2-amino-4-hydroxy-6-hydroxymethyldihydropteridine diphosphokinase, partial [Rhodocyclaceae bacterium]|nr:2-amino-4-hydroxy-6-hydroxymethyldihydropteridine diphosphokinase [Rhodocyclaceae bacterium]